MKFFSEQDEDRSIAIPVDTATPPTGISPDHVESEAEDSLIALRRENRLATFLTSQLTAIGGFWIGAVPIATVLSGGALGGFTGGMVASGVFLASLQAFLSNHPTIPVNTYIRSYGLQIVRRRDNRSLHIVLTQPSERDMLAIEADERTQRRQRNRELEAAAAKRSERKRSRLEKRSLARAQHR